MTWRGLIPSVLAGLGVNLVPAAAVSLSGSAEAAMLIYFLENLIAVLLAAARVRLLAPPRDDTSPNHRMRRSLLSSYLTIALGFTLVNGVFIAAFLFLFNDVAVPRTLVLWGMVAAAFFQLFLFVFDLGRLRGLTLGGSETLLEQSLGRVALLHLAVFVGVIAAAFTRGWFVVPFIVLKTIVDVGTPVQAMLRRG